MKKFIMLAVLLVFAGQANAAEKVTLTIGTIVPQTAAWAQGMTDAAKEIRERTDGRVNFKFRFSEKNADSTLKKMRATLYQGGMFTPSALMDRYADINLYSLPMVFDSAEEAAYVRSRMDGKLLAGLDEAGYVGFGFSATGFAVLMSNKPVKGLADVKNKQVWVPEGDPISYSAMRALEINPQPHPLGDVLVGLQTNLYDMIAVSPSGAIVMQWHTKVDFLTDLPLVYTFGFLVLDKKAFARIEDPADRAIVREVMERVHKDFDQRGIKDDQEAKQAIVKTGVELVVPNDQDYQELRNVLAANNRRLAEEGQFSEELYDEMLGYIAEYRRGHDDGAVEESAAAVATD
jgi:TRAP-type C4-dicarboxylate transport system substrate-binding protein